jgi:WD40 repeat protein
MAAYGSEKGQLVLHETTGGKVIHRDEVKAQLVQLVFAPDGRSLFGRARDPGDNGAGRAARDSLMEWRQAGDGSWSLHSDRSTLDLHRLIATTQGVIAGIHDLSKGELRLDDVATGRSVGSLPLAGLPFPQVFDVTSDFRLAACGVRSGTDQPVSLIEIRNLKTNEPLVRLSPELGTVQHLRFSPDLRLLVCTSNYGIVTYETSRFKVVNTYRQSPGDPPVWCEDGTRLAIPFAQENGVHLCSVLSGTEARLTTGHQVKTVRSSLDGSILLVIPYTGSTLVVRMTGSRERRRLAGHVGGTPAVEYSPDGSLIGSTGKDGIIRIQEALSGKVRHTWTIPRGDPGQTIQGQAIAFSPDGRWLASGNYQNDQVLVWALDDGRQVLALGGGSGMATWSCGFSPDGQILVAAGNGLRGWKLSPGAAGATEPPLVASMLFEDQGAARNLQFHPGGKWIGCEGTLFCDGKEATGSFIRGLEPGDGLNPVDSHGIAVQTLDIDTSGGNLIHMTESRTLRFFDLKSRASTRTLSSLSASEVSSSYILNFKISRDGSKVAITNYNGRGVNIHDLASGRRLYTLPDDASPVWWLAWHPEGRQLAVARGDGDISLWMLPEVEKVLVETGLAP